MEDTTHKRPVIGNDRLVFSLADDEDDRRTHGGSTLRLCVRDEDCDEVNIIDHLKRADAVKLLHELQRQVSRLDQADRKQRMRGERLRSYGYSFEQDDDGYRVLHRGTLIDERLASKEDAFIKAEMHRMPPEPKEQEAQS